ncbi:rap guanine nucleotide exchange factor 1-like isoform X2 [Daphnia pulicaria]|uniref:rap guanine nucleotide exchange factor 1-like isoform X2 n=1 Tax=Daphnia pulicaria TaxID=35523 RepID=UPI001EEB8D28|nr:rap guanine nucleotide exchange factor 1-like isoform X2 [Daphnia pulicaria]
MDKVKKGRLAKRAKSFKEDIIDILSNLRSPPNTNQVTVKPKALPITTSVTNGNEKDHKKELLCLIEDLPSCITLNQHFTNVINKNILQVRYALKFYEDVVVKNTLELVAGSASIVLENVFSILTALGNVSPPSGEHSSSLISATNLVHQALSQLIRWSDDILLQTTTNDGRSTPTITAESSLQSEVRTVVDGLKIAINDLVQVVIHKAANKIPPPSTPQCASPALYDASPLRPLSDKDTVDGLLPAPSLNRVSKSSDGSLLEDAPGSVDWSSDSLPEELDQSPPPKPPLPLKGLLSDFGEMAALSIQDPLTPPPLPPKKRSIGGSLSPMGGWSISPFSPGWGNPPALPDLVPSQPWLNESFDSVMHSNSLVMHGMFERQTQSGWDSSQERRRDVTMAASSTSVFSSSSTSSYASYNTSHHQSSSSAFQCSTSTATTLASTKMSSSEDNVNVLAVPPALPVKRRQRANRLPSQYDNVDQADCGTSPCSSLAGFMAVKQEEIEAFHFSEEKRVQTSSAGGATSTTVQMHREYSSHVEQLVTINSSGSGNAPPLPPKKRHVKEYMAAVGKYSQPSEVEIFRKSMEAYYQKAAQWQTHSECESFPSRSNSYMATPSLLPPVLPPKKGRSSISYSAALALPEIPTTTPEADSRPTTPPRVMAAIKGPPPITTNEADKIDPESDNEDGMEQIDLSADLVLKQPEDEGPEVRGGGLDALITHAAKLNKDDYLYQTAFLTTYRTFITPSELTRKLIHRFHHFLRSPDVHLQRVGRSAFSLLIGVVDDLALSELEDKLMRQIIDFQSQLIRSGDLVLAKALRKKFLEKCTARRLRINVAQIPPVPASLGVTTRQSHLLDFKSSELAEQMTLLDAELFLRIEIPEVLVWAQEQNEEKSPNLTLFTEHFNKMSYWARSRILEQAEARDRERYVVKYIKIMKHLRRLNNFNSYLALLSALDSAPVRRLEWQKSITDGLQEYCALIDSSSSFRAYRQALAETQPPCIPYIGLILQDLTFVHIGNPDTLSDNRINFGKRWQQFHIIENMRRFQKCHYQFKRNDRIVAFFNEFNDSLCEESMWQISESIRPRGSNNSSSAAKK